MEKMPQEAFAHRKNESGTYDSICLYCYRTVATSTIESELAPFEMAHQCRQKAAGQPGLDEETDFLADRPTRPSGEMRTFRRQRRPSPTDNPE